MELSGKGQGWSGRGGDGGTEGRKRRRRGEVHSFRGSSEILLHTEHYQQWMVKGHACCMSYKQTYIEQQIHRPGLNPRIIVKTHIELFKVIYGWANICRFYRESPPTLGILHIKGTLLVSVACLFTSHLGLNSRLTPLKCCNSLVHSDTMSDLIVNEHSKWKWRKVDQHRIGGDMKMKLSTKNMSSNKDDKLIK